MWKYLPTKTYKNFVKNEELMYKIVLDIINKARQEDRISLPDADKESVLMTILNTEGLDDRDKIIGVIGECSFICILNALINFLLDYRFYKCWDRTYVTHDVISSLFLKHKS